MTGSDLSVLALAAAVVVAPCGCGRDSARITPSSAAPQQGGEDTAARRDVGVARAADAVAPDSAGVRGGPGRPRRYASALGATIAAADGDGERGRREDAVTIKLTVDPPKVAHVFWGVKDFGPAPVEIKRPRGSGPLDLVLRAPGYLAYHTRVFTERNDRLSIRLAPETEGARYFGYRAPEPVARPPAATSPKGIAKHAAAAAAGKAPSLRRTSASVGTLSSARSAAAAAPAREEVTETQSVAKVPAAASDDERGDEPTPEP